MRRRVALAMVSLALVAAASAQAQVIVVRSGNAALLGEEGLVLGAHRVMNR